MTYMLLYIFHSRHYGIYIIMTYIIIYIIYVTLGIMTYVIYISPHIITGGHYA